MKLNKEETKVLNEGKRFIVWGSLALNIGLFIMIHLLFITPMYFQEVNNSFEGMEVNMIDVWAGYIVITGVSSVMCFGFGTFIGRLLMFEIWSILILSKEKFKEE